MLSVTFNMPSSFEDLADEYTLGVLQAAADAARAELIRLAQQNLKTSRRAYIAGIQPVMISGNTATITLMGKLANMVEWGWGGGDMRFNLIDKNPKANQEKTHAFIPFRHSSTGALGHDTGGPMPGNIHGMASKLGPTLSAPLQPVKWGQRLPAGNATLMKPSHSTDIYAGMYKMQKTYESSSGASYMTFRTISKKSGSGWHHPGIQSRGFFKQVEEYLQQIVPAMIENSILFG